MLSRELPLLAADMVARLRERRPRVHCITNAAAQSLTANVLLAVGARPSLTISPDEVAGFVASADALLVNLGTFDAERREAVEIALEEGVDNGLPWVLDPVLIERSEPRAAFAAALVARAPRAIRLNRSEFMVLAGAEADDGAQDDAQDGAIAAFAVRNLTVIGLTGENDIVSDGAQRAVIANGSPLMSRVTAMGCAASALVAASLAVDPDAWRATAAALLACSVAGEVAGAKARGPGTFTAEFIDALHGLDESVLVSRARVS